MTGEITANRSESGRFDAYLLSPASRTMRPISPSAGRDADLCSSAGTMVEGMGDISIYMSRSRPRHAMVATGENVRRSCKVRAKSVDFQCS